MWLFTKYFMVKPYCVSFDIMQLTLVKSYVILAIRQTVFLIYKPYNITRKYFRRNLQSDVNPSWAFVV